MISLTIVSYLIDSVLRLGKIAFPDEGNSGTPDGDFFKLIYLVRLD